MLVLTGVSATRPLRGRDRYRHDGLAAASIAGSVRAFPASCDAGPTIGGGPVCVKIPCDRIPAHAAELFAGDGWALGGRLFLDQDRPPEAPPETHAGIPAPDRRRVAAVRRRAGVLREAGPVPPVPPRRLAGRAEGAAGGGRSGGGAVAGQPSHRAGGHGATCRAVG